MTEPDAALRRRIGRGAAIRLGAGTLSDLRELPGGHSGLTWLATFTPDLREPCRVVIKSTPEGRRPVGRHDVLRQARAIDALAPIEGVPVPELLLTDSGTPPLFGMSYIDGRGDEPVLSDADVRPEGPAVVTDLWDQLIVMLVELGRVDPIAIALADDERVLTPADELFRWRQTATAAGPEFAARATPLADALATGAPDLAFVSLVHGDYRLGNTLRADGVIRALIDWEIWSLGDARCDLGWMLLFTEPEAFPGLGHPVAGTPTRAAALDRYAEITGSAPSDAGWFGALACFKLAAIQAHNLRRHREGRRVDEHLERFERPIEALVSRGEALLA